MAYDGLLGEPIQVAADGTVSIPDAPALGIEIDEEKLARYGEKYFEITSRGIALKTVPDKGLPSPRCLACQSDAEVLCRPRALGAQWAATLRDA